jgi:superfamily II DNA or RNA helicase
MRIIRYEAMATVIASPQILDNLKKELTIVTKNMNNKEIIIPLYKTSKDGLEIPLGLIDVKNIPTQFFKKHFNLAKFNFTKELRPNQKILVNNFLNNLVVGGILCAKTGTGKSVMGAYIASKLGLKTLVVVPLTSLIEQWKKVFLDFTDVKEDEIGIIQANKCDVKGKKVVIGMLHTLAKEKFDINNEFGTVIYDEVHKLGAETFSVVAMRFFCRYRIGLSATPRRKDGTDKVFIYNIGKIISSDDKLDIIPSVLRINYSHTECKGVYNSWNNEFNFGKYMTKLSQAKNRNEMLIKLILKLYKKDRNILVLCDRVQHVKYLYEVLKKEIDDVGIFISEKKEHDKKVIIATHGSCGIGIDIPRLDTLIFASPRSDIEQPVGRILRYYEGKKQPLIVDIVDLACKEMKWYAEKRKKFYHKIGIKQIVEKFI